MHACQTLVKCYDNIINSGRYPNDWDMVTVVPWPKDANVNSPIDLRQMFQLEGD